MIPEHGFDILRLDPDYEGSCPCASFTFEGHKYEAHCWRVCTKCGGCGLHYFDGPKATAERLAAILTDMDWYGEWAVRQGPHR